MKIVLIGNYANDRFISMQLFADALKHWLKQKGVECERRQPEPFFGRLRRGNRGIGKWLGYLDKFFVFPRQLKRSVQSPGEPPTIYHICDQSNAHYIRHLPLGRTLVTCHDFMAIQAALGQVPGIPTGWTGRQLQRLIRNGLCNCRHFTAVSQATAQQLPAIIGFSSPDCVVIPNALVQPFHPEPKDTPLDPMFLPSLAETPFYLHVGNDNWYKNRNGLFLTYNQLASEMPNAPHLVPVGPPPSPEQTKLLDGNHHHRVHVFDRLSQAQLNQLYNRSEALLLPSMMEGFGWPILEALACGCPVLTTEKAPMTEVGGEVADYLPDPMPYASLDLWSQDAAQLIKNTLSEGVCRDHSLRQRRIEWSRRFHPDQVFPHYLQTYERLIAEPESPQ